MAAPTKTHCSRGHEFTPENTYVPADGGKRCRACVRVGNRERSRRLAPSQRKTGTCSCGAAIGRLIHWDGSLPDKCEHCAPRVCLIADCQRAHGSRGLCRMHYQRWKAHGDPLTVVHVQRERGSDPEPEFWARVEKTDGCWFWRGSVDGEGYGKFWASGRMSRAHRFAYELLVGPIPEGLTIDHLCCVTGCVNPAHMEPVTRGENIQRSHQRRVYG